MKTGRLTTQERAEVERLAARNFSTGRIAQRLDRHAGTINFVMHTLGLKGPVEREFDYMRNGKRVKSFSKDEDAFLKALRVEGFTTIKIAELTTKRFGHPRTPACVNIRLRMLANLEDAG